MRQHLAANDGTTVVFRGIAVLRSSNPRWMWGFRRATYDFGTMRFIRMAQPGPFDYGYSDMYGCFYVGAGSWFHLYQNGQLPPATAFVGHRVNSWQIGDTSVSLMTAGDASNYTVGNRVLVYSGNKQRASFPLNPKDFDYRKITAISGGTITLDRPLTGRGKSDWKDYQGVDAGTYGTLPSGAARILNLDRAGLGAPEEITIIGGISEFSEQVITVPSSASYFGSVQAAGVSRLTIRGGRYPWIGVSCIETLIIEDCEGYNDNEFDKLISTIICRRSKFNDVVGGTGAQLFMAEDCDFYGPNFQWQGEELHLDNCRIMARNSNGSQVAFGVYPGQNSSIRNCTFLPPSNATAMVGASNIVPFTPTTVSATQITLAEADANHEAVIRAVQVGGTLVAGLSGGTFCRFVVTDFGQDSAGALVITGYSSLASPPTTGWTVVPRWGLELTGNTVERMPLRYNRMLAFNPGFESYSPLDREAELTISMREGHNLAQPFMGNLREIVVDVLKPYTGSDATATVTVGNIYTSSTAVDVKTAGRTTVTVSAGTSQGWSEFIAAHLQGAGGTGAFTDGAATSLPQLTVTYRGTRYSRRSVS
jgi:hypothetical protein